MYVLISPDQTVLTRKLPVAIRQLLVLYSPDQTVTCSYCTYIPDSYLANVLIYSPDRKLPVANVLIYSPDQKVTCS